MLFKTPRLDETRVQLGINGTSGCQTSRLLATYYEVDSRLAILATAFRYWAKVCRIFTARIRRMREGNIFSLFTLAGGGGLCPRSRKGGGGRYLIPGLDKGLPHPADRGGWSSSQVWMGGTPIQGHFRGGIPPPIQDWNGVPPPPPLNQETDQQSEHLLRGGWCASCIYAGGLFC